MDSRSGRSGEEEVGRGGDVVEETFGAEDHGGEMDVKQIANEGVGIAL